MQQLVILETLHEFKEINKLSINKKTTAKKHFAGDIILEILRSKNCSSN